MKTQTRKFKRYRRYFYIAWWNRTPVNPNNWFTCEPRPVDFYEVS